MGADTSIEWATHTFNPWRGCAKVSTGCANCYAETMAKRTGIHGTWGKDGERVVSSDAYWRQPIKWNRDAAREGVRRRVFCASMADVFEDRRDLDGPRERLYGLIEATPNLDWLLLTKRPENAARLFDWSVLGCFDADEWPPNVWLGTSAENQATADERIPHLLAVPAAVRFLSVEPLLGPVDLMPWLDEEGYDAPGDGGEVRPLPAVDWVIVGGESGPGARPCDVAWIRSVRDQCREAGTPCFVKQLGAVPLEFRRVVGKEHGTPFSMAAANLRLRDPKGGDMAEWPEDLRVREFPRGGDRV